MTLGINTNLASLQAQRQQSRSQSELGIAIARLSSGLRINSAKDDAAGLAIVDRFTSRLRGLQQGGRNANDGISLAQTAEGALATIDGNLQRIRELAVQAANGTNSSSDRAALDAEAQQLRSEIDRVAASTKFNGVSLLDGGYAGQLLQVGSAAGQTLPLGLPAASWSALSLQPAATSNSVTGGQVATVNLQAGNLTIDSGSGPVAIVAASGSGLRQSWTAYAKAQAINASNVPGVTASADFTLQLPALTGAGISAANDAVSATGMGASDGASYQLLINGSLVFQATTTGSDISLSVASLAADIQALSATTGVSASVVGGQLQLTNPDGSSVAVQESWTFTDGLDGSVNPNMHGRSIFYSTASGPGADGVSTTTNTGWLVNGEVTLTSATPLTLADGASPSGTPAWALLGFAGPNVATGGAMTSVPSSLDLSQQASAQAAIGAADAALAKVTAGRVQVGAVLHRLDAVVSANDSATDTLSTVRSRVADADFAVETTSLARATILQDAASAMVAQANAAASDVLQLLKA